eukprot:Platyproteum_vivax@DN7049_c0_g1_i4.p1
MQVDDPTGRKRRRACRNLLMAALLSERALKIAVAYDTGAKPSGEAINLSAMCQIKLGDLAAQEKKVGKGVKAYKNAQSILNSYNLDSSHVEKKVQELQNVGGTSQAGFDKSKMSEK